MLEFQLDVPQTPFSAEGFLAELLRWASDVKPPGDYRQPTEALIRHEGVIKEMLKLLPSTEYDELVELLGQDLRISLGWNFGDVLFLENLLQKRIEPGEGIDDFPDESNESKYEAFKKAFVPEELYDGDDDDEEGII